MNISKWMLVVMCLFVGGNIALAQEKVGNGGGTFIMSLIDNDPGFYQELLETGALKVKGDNLWIFENDVRREVYCHEFYNTAFKLVEQLDEKVTVENFLLRQIVSDLLGGGNSIPSLVLAEVDLRESFLEKNLEVLCDPKHFQLGRIVSDWGVSLNAANFPNDALLVVEPDLFEINKEANFDKLGELTKRRNRLIIHELIGLFYNSFENDSRYYLSKDF